MIAIRGFVNIWENIEELRKRQAEGKALAARRFPGDKKWENRLINAAQGSSRENWEILQALALPKLRDVVVTMIQKGAPLDEPWERIYWKQKQ